MAFQWRILSMLSGSRPAADSEKGRRQSFVYSQLYRPDRGVAKSTDAQLHTENEEDRPKHCAGDPTPP